MFYSLCCVLLFFHMKLVDQRATGFTDKEPAILFFHGVSFNSCADLKPVCLLHQCEDIGTLWPNQWPWIRAPLLSGKKAQHCSFCCLLSKDTLLYLFSVSPKHHESMMNGIILASVGKILTHSVTSYNIPLPRHIRDNEGGYHSLNLYPTNDSASAFNHCFSSIRWILMYNKLCQHGNSIRKNYLQQK